MSIKTLKATIVCSLVFATLGASVRAGNVAPILLADSGRTRYTIVLPKDAHGGEELAARELAHFLWRMTGAEFSVGRDSSPETDLEIVLGKTSRKRMEDIPAHLKTDNWEGFSILREGPKLFIMGNLPRGTLYGVYDFLDVELGVRFLTGEVTHVPTRRTLKVDVQSRTYAPPFEHRTIWEALGGKSVVRNRMNGHSFGVANSMLGGVKWIGPPTHTFSSLVSPDKHFDDHPEYFAMIEGERRRTYDGLITQLCMSNPDVAHVALESIRQWLGDDVKADPHNKYLVNVSVNDTPWFCKCDTCVTINTEEGVGEGATYVRFVNAIANPLAAEYPNVAIEAMMYHTSLPDKSGFASNVVTKIVSLPDYRVPLDDPSNERNRQTLAGIRNTKKKIGDGALYCWTRVGLYGAESYLDPRPNLTAITDNFRIMRDNGVRGFFIQTTQSRGTEMLDLRYYLLARAMWRPDLDNRETMEEFCHLFYGAGAADVLRSIDFLHDGYGAMHLMEVPQSNTTINYDQRYLAEGDAILSAAESKAETSETKQRVATCRLPVWKIKLDRAFGEVGKVYTFPVQWSFRMDPQDIGLSEKWQKTTSRKDWQPMRIDKQWTMQGEERRGVGWYAIPFKLPETHGAPLALWFGAIDGDADIFIDGEKVGEQKISAHAMWAQGFYIPLDRKLAPGNHTIAIRVFKENYAAGIWKEVSIVDMSVPIPDDLRIAGRRFIEVARAADLSKLSESYAGHYTQTERVYYPKVEFFLTHGRAK